MLSPRHLLGPLGYLAARRVRAAINRGSSASNPAGLALSDAKLRRLCPELYPTLARPDRLARWLFGPSMGEVFHIRDRLVHGDSRAAVVVSIKPLLVASYCDDLDGVCLLRFPDAFADEYELAKGSRLLTVLNSGIGRPLAPDLVQGTRANPNYFNFHPYIAEFLSDDSGRIARRKAQIDEEEWARAWQLGLEYLGQFGPVARDGRPTRSGIPAPVA